MKFADPLWLFVELAACGLLVWTWRRYDQRQRAALASFASSHLHAQLTASVSPARRQWKRGLLLISLVFLFAALARPQAGYRWEEVKRQGIEILFAVDTSKSMLTQDIKPDRLTRAKLAVDDFVGRLDGDGVGLIAFAGNAFLQCPITLDYNAFNESLAALDTNTIPRGGTDISSAIREAQVALQNRAGNDKILILLTDGEDLDGNAVDAAKAAAQAGLKIYTVGVGTANGDLIPLPAESGGGFVKDASGQYVKSHLDETALEAIAQATGGSYAPLGAQGQGLETIYQTALAPLAKHTLASRQQRIYIERYQWFLLPALFMLLASLLVGTRRKTKRSGGLAGVPFFTPLRRRFMPKSAAVLIGFALELPFSQAKACISDANAAYRKGDFTTAQREFAAAAQHQPQKPVLQFNAGAAAYKAGDYAQASDEFQKSMSGKPSASPQQVADQEDAYYNLGNTLYRSGQKTEQSQKEQTIQTWEQAVKSYDNALQLRKTDADAKFNRDLVQSKLDALKKRQEQEQKQQQQQKDQSQQNQKQQQSSGGQSSPQPNQANNQGSPNNTGSKPDQGQPQNPGQQPGQKSTAQNPGNQQQGDGAKPDQQSQQQANGGNQNSPAPTPSSQGNPQPASPNSGGGSSAAQNGAPVDETNHSSEQRIPGQMSKQEAGQLLDSLRDEQHQMPGAPVARTASDNSSDQPLKDW